MLLKKVYKDAFVLHEESAECPIMLEEMEDALEAKGEKFTKEREEEVKKEYRDQVRCIEAEMKGCHFADSTFNFILLIIIVFWFKFHWSLFLGFQSTTIQHWVR